jgi:hypothetical protein
MGGPLSISGRFIKINACLANVVVYQMSLRIFHKTNIEKLKKPIRTFPWAGYSRKGKYHLVKWKLICKPRSKDGLRIKYLVKLISALCASGVGNWKMIVAPGKIL